MAEIKDILLLSDIVCDVRQQLINDEGLRLKPYKCTAGKLTIGVGRNLDDVGISTDEAIMMLDNDIWRVMIELDKYLPWWRSLKDNHKAAIVNMCFNLGIHGLMNFKKMLTALKNGDGEKAAEEALNSKWATQVGSRADRIASLLRS